MRKCQFTPGPWHDNLANHFEQLARLAPKTAAEYLATLYGLRSPEDVVRIYQWTRRPKRLEPCPVAA